ncbi:MAG: TonB family protein [Thermoanaerobaculia bacterium]
MLEDLESRAGRGDRLAQYRLAQEFYRGEIVPPDLAKSAHFLRLASDQGDPSAASNLGYLLYNGYGVQRDSNEAIRLWYIAADQGQPEAHLHLSRASSEGENLPLDYFEAYARARAAEILSVSLPGDAFHASDQAMQKMAAAARAEESRLRSRLSDAELQIADERAREYAVGVEFGFAPGLSSQIHAAIERNASLLPNPPTLQPMPPVPAHISSPPSEPRERPGLRPLSRQEPQYSEEALASGIQGWVALEFTVSATGRVESPVVVASAPPGTFEEAALGALRTWIYSPEIRDGEPVASPGLRVLLRFTLE